MYFSMNVWLNAMFSLLLMLMHAKHKHMNKSNETKRNEYICEKLKKFWLSIIITTTTSSSSSSSAASQQIKMEEHFITFYFQILGTMHNKLRN